MSVISIVNYGSGNIGAIPNMLKKFAIGSKIANSPEDLENAEKIILPGVGAFGRAMSNLRNGGFIDVLNRKVLVDKVPVLGICLGMQLLSRESEESPGAIGLGWIPGRIKRFSFDPISTNSAERLRVPHMGWNHIKPARGDIPLLSGLADSRFYHVHSYHYVLDEQDDLLASTYYGYDFPSVIARGNIYGAQFHPEKSHRFGLQFLKNFAEV